MDNEVKFLWLLGLTMLVVLLASLSATTTSYLAYKEAKNNVLDAYNEGANAVLFTLEQRTQSEGAVSFQLNNRTVTCLSQETSVSIGEKLGNVQKS